MYLKVVAACVAYSDEVNGSFQKYDLKHTNTLGGHSLVEKEGING